MTPFERKEKDFYTRYYQGAIGLTVVGFQWADTVDMSDYCANCGTHLPSADTACVQSADTQHKAGDIQPLEYFEQMPVLVCRTQDGQTVELAISQDPEGNGPGFLFGLPDVAPST